MATSTKPRSAKKRAAKSKAPATPVVKTTYMLRTCAKSMRSHNDFKWPTSGPVECPDWNARKACGNGLHGLLHGEGAASLLDWSEDAVWLVVAVDADSVVKIDDEKVKVPRGNVVFCGERGSAIAKLIELDSKASASRVPCGQASSSGDYGQASSSGDYGQASSSGQRGQASSLRGRARAGDKGILILFHRDEAADRDRVVVGYIGEDGIEPGKWYKLDAAGKIIESPENDPAFDRFVAAPFECAADAKQLELALRSKKS